MSWYSEIGVYGWGFGVLAVTLLLMAVGAVARAIGGRR